MKKTYKVTVLENRPVWVDYIVEAESEEEAREDYGGWPVVDEEIGTGTEEVVEVKELTTENE